MTPRTVVEGFAGPGGWDEGAALVGMHGIVGYETDKAACITATKAGHVRVRQDVTTVHYRPSAAWGYISSPPCQPWSRAGKGLGLKDQPAIVAHVHRIIRAGEWIDYPSTGWHDEKSPLVLEVIRAVMQARPTWLALEQVPDVLPFWELCAVLFRTLGYRVWCGVLDAEMYGVPQTRDRAILTASLDPTLAVSRPPATHHRYRPGQTIAPDLFDDLLPPVCMADALGWGMTGRPSMTVTAGGGSTGGAEPFGNQARQGMKRERDAAAWVVRTSMGSPKVDGVNGSHELNPFTRPSHAVTTKAGEWVAFRPATTVQGDPRIAAPGHKDRAGGQRQFDEDTVRISVVEAATLQSFRTDYPWHGSRTKQYEQIGNAVPPLLACAVLGHLHNRPGWRDVCRDTYRAEAAA